MFCHRSVLLGRRPDSLGSLFGFCNKIKISCRTKKNATIVHVVVNPPKQKLTVRQVIGFGAGTVL